MTVGIYGLGRFGYFYAGLLARYRSVKAYSRDKSREAPAGVERVSEEQLLRLPVIILCVAISAMREVLQRIAPRLHPGTLVMDTCSVKSLPAHWMLEALPVQTQILATHPMFGPDSAVNGVRGLPMILCPVRIATASLESWKSLFERMGLKVLLMDPREHDREAAFTQGLTHYLGRVLAQLQPKPSEMGSLGYRKLLEIIEQTCNDSWQLFQDLQCYNPYTPQMRRKLNRSLERIRHALDRLEDAQA